MAKKEIKADYEKLPIFSRRIIERRRALGLTQVGLARLVWPDSVGKEAEGTKRKCIVGYENGKRPKEYEDYIALCKALGCDIGYLLGERECLTKDIQGVKNYLGLSEVAIRMLHFASSEEETIRLTSSILESPFFWSAMQSFVLAASLKDEIEKIKRNDDRLKADLSRGNVEEETADDIRHTAYEDLSDEIKKKYRLPENDLGISDNADFYSMQAERFLLLSLRSFKDAHKLI